MNKINLSCSVEGINGSIMYPSWKDILLRIQKTKELGGSMYLSIIDGPDFGPVSLEIRGENGYYLMTLLDNITEGDDEVRSYDNLEIDSMQPKIEILGDYWPMKMLTCDFTLVTSVCREFYETGDVSQEILSV
ncbi:DUF6911 family protein [Vibrio gazogenes]|uniref:Uncharacterized protein n=1 Tax=Vibrio gazogenes TaxID=687 RepID=A0A1Z2SLX8_VIBGA|nr:hypothetical protein [Vibrio gazogenes]ASA58218.1 hypothetical protein BSQ33_21290 [Vibrio gazogenes]